MNRLFSIAIGFVFVFLITVNSNAQESLTLDQAFEIALANNFDIKVIKKQVAISENSATLGNAGLLPSINANASAGVNVNNTELEFAGNIPPTNVDNAQSTNLSLGINANYTIFNGLSGKNTYEKLQLNRDALLMQSRATMESTLLQVANAFYVLARANEQVDIATKNTSVSINRYQRAQLANELGTSLRVEMLSARVDLSSDSAALLTAIHQEKSALRSLGVLLGKELAEGIVADISEPELNLWNIQDLIAKAESNNALQKNAEMQMELANTDYKISKASFFPSLSLSGGYGINQQQNEAGIVLSNTAAGWNGSIALSYPLFNGFRSSTQRQNQKLSYEIRELELSKLKMELSSDIQNANDNYNQSFELMEFEKKNLESAELNLERSQALFAAGVYTSTQFREAQVAMANTQTRYSNSKMSVLINELEILRLTGQILGK